MNEDTNTNTNTNTNPNPNKGWMARFQAVPIPARMSNMDRDKRGYPIPFIVLRDSANRPHFTINDTAKVLIAKHRGLCSICGKSFERMQDGAGRLNPHPENAGMWFVGGPLSALHPHGAYIDPPVHRECGEYALQVCPYLAAPSYAKRIEDGTFDYDANPGVIGVVDHTMLPDRPDAFAFVRCHGWKPTGSGLGAYMKPTDVVDISFWRHGARLDSVESAALFNRYMREIVEGKHNRSPT